MKGSITAIVPTFNRADYLQEAVTALLAQSRPLHQIILWNDGSTDHTEAVMAGFAGSDATEVLCRTARNGGKSKALNRAMSLATGDYIWVCDDDDLVRPEAAQTLAHTLDTSHLGWVAGRHVRFHNDPETGEKVLGDTGYWPDLSAGNVLRHLLEDIFFFQPGTLVRRSAYDVVGPFNEAISRSIDYEMFVRLAARFPGRVLDQIVFEQRKHDGERGAGESLHSAAQSEAVWKAMDREIFAGFRDQLPLSLYEGLFDGHDPQRIRRAALLQRACVYARRSDWPVALEDFHMAAGILPELPLSDTEHGIVRRAMAGKHGCSEAYGAPIRGDLAACAGYGTAGRGILRTLARGSIWRLRTALAAKDFGEAARIARFLAVATLQTGGRKPQTGDRLRERETLLPGAYSW